MLVALLAGVGAVLRYLVDRAVQGAAPAQHFPRGTVVVNTTGSFVLGVVVAAGGSAALSVGLLGGYTTLSAFAVETVALAERDRRGAAVLNVLVSAGLGVLAARLGMSLGRRL